MTRVCVHYKVHKVLLGVIYEQRNMVKTSVAPAIRRGTALLILGCRNWTKMATRFYFDHLLLNEADLHAAQFFRVARSRSNAEFD